MVLADDKPSATVSSMTPRPYKIVFLCIHNAGRSQMARWFFNQMADPNIARAVSCGTDPIPLVHPEVIEVMRELRVDLVGERPRLLTDEITANATLIVSMGCGDQCPTVPGAEQIEWDFPDPKGQPIEVVRRIRDEIRAKVRELVESRYWAKQPINA